MVDEFWIALSIFLHLSISQITGFVCFLFPSADPVVLRESLFFSPCWVTAHHCYCVSKLITLSLWCSCFKYLSILKVPSTCWMQRITFSPTQKWFLLPNEKQKHTQNQKDNLLMMFSELFTFLGIHFPARTW